MTRAAAFVEVATWPPTLAWGTRGPVWHPRSSRRQLQLPGDRLKYVGLVVVLGIMDGAVPLVERRVAVLAHELVHLLAELDVDDVHMHAGGAYGSCTGQRTRRKGLRRRSVRIVV